MRRNKKERERIRYRIIINFQTLLGFQKLLISITHSYTCQNARCKGMGRRQELSVVFVYCCTARGMRFPFY